MSFPVEVEFGVVVTTFIKNEGLYFLILLCVTMFPAHLVTKSFNYLLRPRCQTGAIPQGQAQRPGLFAKPGDLKCRVCFKR